MVKNELLYLLNIRDPYYHHTHTFNSPDGLIKRILNIIPDPDLICEVGCWTGESTKAWALKSPSDTIVVAVDTWLGSAEHYIDSGYRAQLHSLYESFLWNTYDLSSQILPLRLSSVAAADLFEQKKIYFDIVYLDAGHSTDEVLLDMKRYYWRLTEGGILCGDDWTWTSVRNAVETFAHTHNLNIEHFDNSWILLP